MRGALLAAVTVVSVYAQSQALDFVPVASSLSQPVHVTHAGDGSGRLFIVEQEGRIKVLKQGALLAAPFLDIVARVGCCGERGLLSVAFPPGFAEKRYFYVYYTDRAGDIIIARYRVGASPDVADPASESILLTIPHRQFGNHNGGSLEFGPDGYLYIGTGDGGGGGDTLGNGQNRTSLLGKLLRIDTESGQSPYAVPSSNPFVSTSGARGEIWAYGLRNPWRISFDRATGDLYVGDVGQGTYEEIDFQPASSRGGENYGWNLMEGAHCFQGGCNMTGLTLPVAEYSHSAGDCSVTGGFVYRGTRIPSLQGVYVYGDYCTGRILGLRRTGAAWQNSLVALTGRLISSFGEDEAGELYVVHHGGAVYAITGGPPRITSEAVVNAASGEPGLVPGSIASIYGAGITTAAGIVLADSAPLPRSLNASAVLVNGSAAPVMAVANVNGIELINFQVPFELTGPVASVAVTSLGVAGPAVQVQVLAAQPALFTTDGVRAAALKLDYSAITETAPARRGDIVLLFATGLGAVANQPATGALTPSTPLSPTLAEPQVTIGGATATVLFSGLAPAAAGQYLINIVVPAGTPSGDQDVVIGIGGHTSKPAKIRIE